MSSHHARPLREPSAQIEDDLLRQNSLIHYGWTLFRWTETPVRNQPNRVKEELLLFLSRIPGLFRATLRIAKLAEK